MVTTVIARQQYDKAHAAVVSPAASGAAHSLSAVAADSAANAEAAITVADAHLAHHCAGGNSRHRDRRLVPAPAKQQGFHRLAPAHLHRPASR